MNHVCEQTLTLYTKILRAIYQNKTKVLGEMSNFRV